MELEDKQIACKDCGAQFTFTAGEQEFYRKKGFEHAPTRCKNCRETKKTTGGGGGGGGSREMFSATCTQCGAPTQVPFNPSPGKPVYCRDCYQSRKR